MVVELAATTVGVVSNALQVINTVREVAKDAQINTALSSVVNDLLNAQAMAAEAQRQAAADAKRIADLEKENNQLKDWISEKARYELYELKPGKLAYRVKQGHENGEPPHGICTKCYSDGRKSILQIIPGEGRTTVAHCPTCKTGLDLSRGDAPVRWR